MHSPDASTHHPFLLTAVAVGLEKIPSRNRFCTFWATKRFWWQKISGINGCWIHQTWNRVADLISSFFPHRVTGQTRSLTRSLRVLTRAVGLLLPWIAPFIMVALCNRADHYLYFHPVSSSSSSFFFLLLLLFFPHLISAVGNWMFTILWHMMWP